MGLTAGMSYYPIAYVKTDMTRFLTRKDFENMLSASDVEQAIKTIIDKPIGLKIYEEMKTRRHNLAELLGIIDEYEYMKLKQIYANSSSAMKRVFNLFRRLFDTFNTYTYIPSIIISEKPSLLFYFGSYPETIDSEGKIIVDKLPREVRFIIRESISTKRIDVSKILSILPSKQTVTSLPINTRIVYGVFHDFFISKLCMSGYSIEPKYTIVVDDSILRDICNQTSIDGLLNILRAGNTYMNAYSEILALLQRKVKTINIIDLASLIFGFSRAKALINTEEDIATRSIVLSLGEGLLTKYSLVSVDTGYFRDLVRDIINRWWPL